MQNLSTLFLPNISNTFIRQSILALLGSVFIAISAQITVPMFPVPMTMQTFAVFTVGMFMGARLGALTVMLYIAEGLVGMPVFAGGKFGLATLLGPTGGYLIGYVIAAYAVGFMAEKGYDKKPLKIFAAMILGNALIYAAGLLQLGVLFGFDKPLLAWGLTPFILGDFVKAGIASALFPVFWNKLSK